MRNGQLDSVLHYIRNLLAVGQTRELPDRELLERFVTGHDETAFSAIVERHGPVVMGVCRRTLRSERHAEDACQATFLVLVRKAGSIRKRASLGWWLYGVAYRVARKLRADIQRRAARDVAEVLPGAFPDWRCEVVALELERSFWEKATILHTEHHRPVDKPTPDRFSRHYADMAALAQHPGVTKAIEDHDPRDRVVAWKGQFFGSS